MRKTFNIEGNIEIEGNMFRYRFPLTEFKSDDIEQIEKNMKLKVRAIEHFPYYLTPSQIETLNHSLVLYYDLTHYKSYDWLRELAFKEQLKYFESLIEIAKNQSQALVLWDRHNFVVDPYDEVIKAIIFETEDMAIYEKRDELQGVKSLMISSLTVLDEVYAKPSRSDFLNKSDDVIEFVEQLLQIDNIEDMDHYVNTKRLEHEHQIEEKETTDKKPKEKTKKQKSVPKSKKPKRKTETSDTKNKLPVKKRWILVGVVLIFAFVINSFSESIVGSGSENTGEVNTETPASSQTDGESSADTTSSKYKDELLQAYRQSLAGNYESAIEILEEVGYENLGQSDKNIMLNVYEDNENYAKAIDLNGNRAEDIVNEIVSSNNVESLVDIQDKMETTNPYVGFEVAFHNENYEKVITLMDQVDLNGRKEEQIVDSYIALEEYEKAERFARNIGNPELVEKVERESES